MRGNSHNGKKCSNKAHRKKKIMYRFFVVSRTHILQFQEVYWKNGGCGETIYNTHNTQNSLVFLLFAFRGPKGWLSSFLIYFAGNDQAAP